MEKEASMINMFTSMNENDHTVIVYTAMENIIYIQAIVNSMLWPLEMKSRIHFGIILQEK